MNKLKLLIALSMLAACFAATFVASHPTETGGDTSISLKTVLPKLQAIHEDAKSLLIKNGELKAKILGGLQAQNEAKLKLVKEGKLTTNPNQQMQPTPDPIAVQVQPPMTSQQLPVVPHQQLPNENEIDYSELDEFNKWVDVNLEYAVKNTQLSIETLKDEAAQNNGNINYSEQAIKDGIEGVKYWQSAVIFQDKTLKNEKYEID